MTEQENFNKADAAIANEAQNLLEKKESELRFRNITGNYGKVVSAICIFWSLFQIYATTFSPFDAISLRAWHILFLIVLSFILYPAWKNVNSGLKFPTFIDIIGIGAGVYSFGFLLLNYTQITLRGGYFEPIDHVVASIAIIACFEMARRVVGNLAWLAFAFFAYNFIGAYIPGAFGHAGFSWNRVVDHMFWGSQGLLGIGVGVSATYIFLFILFGTFLKYSGFTNFINDLALTLVGRSAGGPAKVSVLASALMGMINGSALANVATTGAITIPLMKKTGYKAEFAGAVEAVASTGGQFAPPIMGAVGFIMAEFLGVPYTTVMLAAAIPAFLYYLTLLIAVHFEAKKLGLKGLSAENIPSAIIVLKERGHLLIPLIVLLVVLFMGYTPLYAANVSILTTIVASWLSKDTRMSFKTIIRALDEGARGAVGVGVACVIIGIIIGTVSLTGLGLTFGYEILKYVSDGQLYLGGVLVMLMSIVLGMGVPGVAAYVIVATVAAPILIKLGATPLASHMFCLIYACLSNITPPVAMSSYIAAGIAKSNQTQTSIIAVKLGLSGFILPLFFLDNPLLLYSPEHGLMNTIGALISAMLGVCALAAGLLGWLFGPCNIIMRVGLFAVALLCLDPNIYTDISGLALFGLICVLNKKSSQSA